MSDMANEDTRKTIRFKAEEVKEIEQAIEENPELKGRPFSNAVRWLIRVAIGGLDKEEDGEQK